MKDQYKLVKWYPDLPKKWNVGDIFEHDKEYQWLHNTKEPIISFKISINEIIKHLDCWQKVDGQEYIVTQIKTPGGIIIYYDDNGKCIKRSDELSIGDTLHVKDLTNYKNYRVHAVKRLSDGKVFERGDYIKNNHMKDTEGKITGFSCHKSCVAYFGNSYWQFISGIDHVERFETKDGKFLFKGDIAYGVCPKSTWQQASIRAEKMNSMNAWLFFSTKEVRNKYIEEYKPRFSRNNVRNALTEKFANAYGRSQTMFDMVDKIIEEMFK